jgi:teichuronic acid exporter
MKSTKNIFRSVFMQGMQWSFVSSATVSILSIVYYAILTRYLTPEDFGLFSIGMIFIGFIEFFAGAGVSAVVIQMKKISEEQYSTFFWLNIGIGLLFALLLILLAPLIAGFFQAEKIIPLLYILAGVSVVNALSLLHNNILRREFQIARSEKIEMAATIIQIVSGIGLAISGHAMLSLPLAFFAGKSVSCFGYLWVGKKYFWPAFFFRYHGIRHQLSLGSYQVFERFFNYVRANVDKFVIGKFLGTEALGYYSFAQKMVDLPLSKINPVLNKVLFPYFSRLQERPKIIAKIYLNVTTFLTVMITPALLFAIFFANEIVSLVLDASYESIGTLIKILSVLGLLRSYSNIGGNVLNALGKFRTGFYWNVIWSISLTIVLVIASLLDVNLHQMTCIIFLTNLGSFFVWHSIIFKYINLPFKDAGSRFLLVSFVSGAFLFFLKTAHGLWFITIPFWIIFSVYLGLIICLTGIFAVVMIKKNPDYSFRLWT